MMCLIAREKGDRKKLQILTHLIQENISICANFVLCVISIHLNIYE